MNALVIAAHPDDEVLGCGGTIARLAGAGHDVYILILGEGITSRYDCREAADPADLEALREKCRASARRLGARDVFLESLPDNRFDTVPLLDVIKKIEKRIEQLKPEVVYTQHGGDLNIDHVTTFRATLTATRPMPGGCVRAVYAYEVASSTEWAFQQFEPVFHPQVFVDISGTLERKIEAMNLYESEARPYPHPRSAEILRAIAQRWGSVSGLPAAEAFECVWSIEQDASAQASACTGCAAAAAQNGPPAPHAAGAGLKVDVVCANCEHPVWVWLGDWRARQGAGCSVRLLNCAAYADGGDFLFLISCGEIVRTPILSKYRHALVIHASDLPEGRGWSPHIWQILAGRTRFTVSLFEAADKLDAGPIWKKEVVELEGHELYDEINRKLFDVELRLMDYALAHADTVKPQPQEGTGMQYYRKRKPEDSRLDPGKSLADQFDLLRVADPHRFPVFFDFRGQRYIVQIRKDKPETGA
ncbi:MAG TPA: PIG-L family deacetylase [Kiritimatiellia bacterium]|nr:PIG-L family deacetylase [Kiritimatiellia bacterium]HRZ11477.1 PIG-L family deacetylase [Kiritimatiellia bacterium]HSA16972.1 PIG-L family deacetylase [Kiritimatiellia bacterium]